jgi:hypothetical protein
MAIDVNGARIVAVMIFGPNKKEHYIGAACGLASEIVSNTRMKEAVQFGICGQDGKTLND